MEGENAVTIYNGLKNKVQNIGRLCQAEIIRSGKDLLQKQMKQCKIKTEQLLKMMAMNQFYYLNQSVRIIYANNWQVANMYKPINDNPVLPTTNTQTDMPTSNIPTTNTPNIMSNQVKLLTLLTC